MVKDINPGEENSYPFSLSHIHVARVNGFLFFPAHEEHKGVELWKTNGTRSGTGLVKDIHPGMGSSFPTFLKGLKSNPYFVSTDGVLGMELWQSDGTTEGTSIVKDINPTGNGSPSLLTKVNNSLFFVANDGQSGFELWKTDGSKEGTILVKDIHPGPGGGLDYVFKSFSPLPFSSSKISRQNSR